jgi:hypothetical protein
VSERPSLAWRFLAAADPRLAELVRYIHGERRAAEAHWQAQEPAWQQALAAARAERPARGRHRR